ncbi:hypothetical protein [Amycolatopsis solani]|uniref:hypothetical protein n=1 Tax=Amycolatopsis solani TaxID=3028615 RepID=UPI00296ECF3D|nr:hypothetical protein [Amycolatopsis sp. MEP2-6]
MNPVSVGVVAALVSLSGIVVGWLTARQANRRLNHEHADEEARLRLDAAMRAGELFSAKDSPADPAAVASGLLALTKLDNAELAVALLVNLWSEETPQVAPETAVLVVDAALRSTGNAQLVAAELLCRNANRLDPCHSLHWPSAIDGDWDQDFCPKTKLLLIDALVGMTLAHPNTEDALRSVAVRLYGVWRGDENPRVRGCVGRLIGAVVPALRQLGYIDFMQGKKTVLLSELETAAASGTHNPDGYLDRMVEDRCKKLCSWAHACEHADPATRLATAV